MRIPTGLKGTASAGARLGRVCGQPTCRHVGGRRRACTCLDATAPSPRTKKKRAEARFRKAPQREIWPHAREGHVAKGPLEVIYAGGASACASRAGRRCDNEAPTIDIHDSIGRLDATRAASCGTSPANSAERKIQRQGRVQAKPAPTMPATSTRDQGLRCAIGLTTALEASFAICATGRIGWCDHHAVTDSITALTSGKAPSLCSSDSPRGGVVPGAGAGGGIIARRKRVREASMRSSTSLMLRSLHAASRGRQRSVA